MNSGVKRHWLVGSSSWRKRLVLSAQNLESAKSSVVSVSISCARPSIEATLLFSSGVLTNITRVSRATYENCITRPNGVKQRKNLQRFRCSFFRFRCFDDDFRLLCFYARQPKPIAIHFVRGFARRTAALGVGDREHRWRTSCVSASRFCNKVHVALNEM